MNKEKGKEERERGRGDKGKEEGRFEFSFFSSLSSIYVH